MICTLVFPQLTPVVLKPSNFTHVSVVFEAIEKNKLSSKFGFTSRAAKQSSYVAVYWNKKGCKWRACFNHAKQTHYCGTFPSELEAAHSINRKCDELGITRKNPSIGTPKNTSLKPYGEFEEEESSSTSEEMSVNQYFQIFSFHSVNLCINLFYYRAAR